MQIDIKDSFEIDSKRCYIPAEFDWECPHCGSKQVHDLGDDYLSYPMVNKPNDVHMSCDNCYEESTTECTIRMSIELSSKIRKEDV
jgi:hypothetical protein